MVEFVVERDSTISQINAAKSVHPILDMLATKHIENTSGHCSPAKIGQIAVRSKMTVPVTFHFKNKETVSMEELRDMDNVTMPSYPEGGQQGLLMFLAKNTKYPKSAREMGHEGRVATRFVIVKDGSIVDAQVVRSSGYPELDAEAIRVISSMPKRNPGTLNGRPIRVRFTLPVMFRGK